MRSPRSARVALVGEIAALALPLLPAAVALWATGPVVEGRMGPEK